MSTRSKKVMELLFFLFFLIGCTDNSGSDIPENLKISLSADRVEVEQEVFLKIENIDVEEIQKIQWDLGDGTISNEKEIAHCYKIPGIYTISVNVILRNEKVWTTKSLIEVYYPEVTENQRPSIPTSLHKNENVLICAHRGYKKDSPENSMNAVTSAIEKGIDMVELDVRMTKDGKLVLMHDATIERMTNGTGKVSELSYAELLSYSLYNDAELTIEKIPLFSEILSISRGRIYIDIDVKISDYKAVYDLVKQYGMLSQVMFTVYETAVARRMMTMDKNIVLLPVIYNMEDLNAYLAIIKPLLVAQFNSAAFINDILNQASQNNVSIFKNIYVNTSITPTSDNYKQVREFLAKKGSIIQTDFPIELKEFIKKN